MQISEILRGLADLVDSAAATSEQHAQNDAAGAMNEPAVAEPEASGQLVQVDIDHEDGTEPATMISPLQQEHELMKKQTGVENHVEEFAAEEGGQPDELDAMKRNAGIGEESNAPVDHGQDARPVSLNPRANAAREFHGKQHLPHTKHRDQK